MRKMTIAEMREKELSRLVAYKTATPTEADYTEARRTMNSFYRLCGLCERNLYLANDERTYNRESTRRSEERESNWYNRLNQVFTTVYGLQLVYCGYCPSIGVKDVHGGFTEKVSRYFYQ